MSISFIPTKISIPKRAPGVVRRQRLTDFLHDNLGRKLLLVTAPAGYGKTTLLVDFASEADFPVCWYTLDEGDRDPSTFMAYLVASIRRKFPKFGERSTSLSESGGLSARAAAAALVGDMVTDIPEYFVLILDDWHLVSEEAAIREMLDLVLQYLPEHAHLIVAGRALPRGPLVRLAAQSAVAGLGSTDLHFTPPEVRELLASRYDLQISDEQAAQLVEDSEGWITGILLTSQAMWQGLLAGLVQSAGAPGALYDYLAGEVFDRLSPPLRRFLLESAVPRQFTAEMCDQLRRAPGSAAWIEQAEARNVFLTRVVADSETWYHYHHLFRDFLLARFQRDDPAGLARLHIRAGEWFESQHQPDEAVDHFLAGGAPDRAARVMNDYARRLFIAGRTQTLLRWAEQLPVEIRPIAPELVLFQGQVLMERGQPLAALPILEQAESGYRTRDDAAGQMRAILLQGWSHYARGKLRDALEIGRGVLARLAEARADEPALEAQAQRLVGMSYSSLGQWQDGEKHLAQALTMYRHSNSDERHAYNLGRTLHDLAYTLRFMGRLEEAAALQAESLSLWRQIGNPGPLAGSLNMLGYDRFLVGDYDSALALYAEALTKAEEAEDKRTQAVVREGIASVHRDRGEFQRAIEIYQEALNMASEAGDQAQVSWVLDGLGHAHRLANDLERAQFLFEQARRLAEREGIDLQVMLSSASIGIAQVEQGNLFEGAARLEQVCDTLRAANADLDLARTLFWLSRAYFESKHTALARDRLAEMSRLGHRLGCRPFSLADGRRAVALLNWGAAQFPADTWLRAWIDTLRVDVGSARLEVVEARPEPVRIEAHTFGPGRVIRDGRLLTVSEWGGSAIARELFFYLLDRSPQRKEEIGAVFWPDLSPPRMTSAFHAAKYKMHRALGAEIVIYEDEQYQIDPSSGLWSDVVEFRRRLDAARRLAPDDPERLNELEQAATLYTGDFLTDIYSDWAEESRRTLRSRYMGALHRLVEMLRPRRMFERVLELCQRGLEFDYFREDLHRVVMSALAEIGRLAEALAHYSTLTQRLMQEFNAEPEPETIELANRIRARRLG